MITKSITLTLCLLTLMLAMYQCKRKDADPLEPDKGLVADINKIEVLKVELAEPAPVIATESKIEASEQTTTLSAGINSLAATGTEPASLKASATQFSTSISASDIAALTSVPGAVLKSVIGGAALPANLLAIVNKIAANPSLASYLPRITMPTVAGKEVKGARISSGSASEQVEATAISDECLLKAQGEYDKVKEKLDASHKTQLTGAANEYASEIALLPAAQSACTTATNTKYATLYADAEALLNKLSAALDARKESLGAEYDPLKALLYFEMLAYFNSLNVLQSADLQSCTEKTKAATINAQTALDKNNSAIEAAYRLALDAADKAKADLAQSCHNQGGGN